jgi:hypothetical protein
MTTETLIKKLRSFLPQGPLAQEIMTLAAARLELMEWELTQAIAERAPHDYGLLKEEAAFLRKERDDAFTEVKRLKMDLRILNETVRNDQQLATRPEPSRMEIAAIIWAGMQHKSVEVAVKIAGQLIAEVKETK